MKLPRLKLGPCTPFWDVAALHLPLTVMAGGALLLSSLLPLRPPRIIPCWFLDITGHPCPFCGMTRAFTAMGHGQWGGAWHESPLGVVLYLVAAIVLVGSLAGLALRRRITVSLGLPVRIWILLGGILIAANWAYRWCVGLR